MAAQKLSLADVKEEMVKNRLVGNVSKAQVSAVLAAFVAEVQDCMVNGYSVSVPGLATFVPVLKEGAKKGTKVRNPGTGEEKVLKSDKPDFFAVKIKKSSAFKQGFPSLKAKAGQELAKQLRK